MRATRSLVVLARQARRRHRGAIAPHGFTRIGIVAGVPCADAAELRAEWQPPLRWSETKNVCERDRGEESAIARSGQEPCIIIDNDERRRNDTESRTFGGRIAHGDSFANARHRPVQDA